jgi:predicted RNase H-like nuclease (RuvC/YqgF family)
MTINQMQEKIAEYKKRIVACNMEIADFPQRYDIEAENKREIRDYTERIERLTKRIAGITDTTIPTKRQIQIAAWVNSPAYDNE